MARTASSVPADDSFASTLRALMWDRRLGVAELAKQSGVSARLIAKYRAGTSAPRDYFGEPTDNGRAIARVLGVTVDRLLPPASAEPEDVVA